MESFFYKFLKAQVEKCANTVAVTYDSSVVSRPKAVLSSSVASGLDASTLQLKIRILSPIFFTRVAHYASVQEALISEGRLADETKRTVLVDDYSILAMLLQSEAPVPRPGRTVGLLDRCRWTVLRLLRWQPASKTQENRIHAQIIPSPSSLDHFINSCCPEDVWVYRRLAIRQLLAVRFAFGIGEIIDISDLLLRASLVYIGMHTSLVGGNGIQHYLALPITLQSVHLWAALKG
jgi:hypothetical protein